VDDRDVARRSPSTRRLDGRASAAGGSPRLRKPSRYVTLARTLTRGDADMRQMVIAAALALVIGCGGDDADTRPRLPVLSDIGGPKLANVQVVSIFFSDDLEADGLATYTQTLIGSQWLVAVGGEYGVGAGSYVGTVHRTDPAPAAINDGEIVDLLFKGLADASLPQPAGGTAEALYMLHVPAQTQVTLGTARSCVDFGGYHSSARRNGVELAYAVIAACGDRSRSTFNQREIVTSHELIEAATDPFPANHPGIQLRDPTSPWLALGEEVGDLCQRGDNSEIGSAAAGVLAQRSWSNTAAVNERDPCVPALSDVPYFNVVTDAKTLLRIAPGKHQTVQITGWASAKTTDWGIRASPSMPGEVTLAVGADRISEGATTSLDITVPATAAVGTTLLMFVVSQGPTTYSFLPLRVIAADPCASYAGCADCSSHLGCGFCTTTGKCESQSADGSADSSCPVAAFATWPGSCPGFCAPHSASCTDCASQPGCGWCAGGAPACMEASHEYSHPETGTCAYADWSFTPSYCPL
jgi:hypothetical protein